MCIIPCKDSTISANGKTNARKRLTPSPDGARRSCRVKQAEHHGHASTAREAAKPSLKAALTSASTDLSDPWAVIPGFNTSFSGERDVTKRHLPMKWVKNEDSPRETRHFGSPNGPFHTAICDVLQRKTAYAEAITPTQSAAYGCTPILRECDTAMPQPAKSHTLRSPCSRAETARGANCGKYFAE